MQLSPGAFPPSPNKETPPFRPPASALPNSLSGSESSVSAPPALTATQRTGLPGATLCPSSRPGRLLRPPVSTLPCRATGPCHRPPQQSTPRHSCAMLVTRPRNGQPSAPAPSPPPPPLTVLTTPGRSGDGSASLPVRAMSAPMRRILLTSLLRLVRCCSRRQGNSPPAPSTFCPPAMTWPSPVRSSVSFCCGACDSPSRSHRADAAATVCSTARRPPHRLCDVGRARHPCAALGACRRARLPRSWREGRHVRLADMNLDVPVSDERRIEVVANGLPLWHGSQLALDATIVSPLTRRGRGPPARRRPAGLRGRCRRAPQAHPDIPRVGPSAPLSAGRRRRRSWRQVWYRSGAIPAPPCWPSGSVGTGPPAVRRSRLLGRPVAAQRAYAATLLELPPAAELGEGPMPTLHEVLADARWG